MKQTSFLKSAPGAYGGTLMKSRKGRARPRPLSTRETMHLVLRSTQARGDWSFALPRHRVKIRALSDRFGRRYGVRVLSLANVGNHLHFHVQLGNRQLYRPFIRALTGAIALSVTGSGRGRPLPKGRFWDYRPFTRVIQGFRALLGIRDYLEINRLEGLGVPRAKARIWIARARGS